VHLALTKHMHVNVVDRLATQVVAVHHDAKALLATLLFGEALGSEEDMPSESFVVLFAQVVECRYMLLRNDQEMHRRLWRNVVESDDLIVFKYLLRGDFPGHDLAK